MDPQALRFVPAHLRGLFCSSPVTFWRWCVGKARPPRSAVVLAHILVNGDLPQGGAAWDGWGFKDGLLYSPEGVGFAPGEIRALPYLYALKAELQRGKGQALDVLPFPEANLRRG